MLICHPDVATERHALNRLRAITGVVAAVGLAGCSQSHSALRPAGPEAEQLAWLIWLFITVSAATWLLVMVVLLAGIRRRRGPRSSRLLGTPVRERRLARVIASCVALTAIVVIALTVVSYRSQAKLFVRSPVPEVRIKLIGHQWWWEVQYPDDASDRQIVTANEIHVPVDRPVALTLETRDVIHSFWVPSLAGKMDQITGHTNTLHFSAARAGVYRGQCAEFCGRQHAQMGIIVVASPGDSFERWKNEQIAPAAAPPPGPAADGLRVFMSRGCMLCHTIRGTLAGGTLGPDLTHLASRRTVAAGALDLSAGALGAWIADPQHIKPGSLMPQMALHGSELSALVSYLMSLR